MKKLMAATAATVVAVAIAACGGDEGSGASDKGSELPKGSEHVSLDPADFTTNIDNRYWPMTPGSKWVYREQEGGEMLHVEVTVTDQTKVVDGVTIRVIHDVVSKGGEPVEVTDDWYAQDKNGNIWYFGEDTKEYQNGKVSSTEGSFEAGVDGAEPGVALPGHPEVGVEYRQEYKAGQAEDFASVLSLDAKAEVPFGSFDAVLQTKDTNPLNKPDPAVEQKFYAPGVGPVLTLGAGGGREELVSYTKGA